MLTDNRPEPLRSDMLTMPNARGRHGFFTRSGGVSGGIYAGLNAGLGSDDNRTHITENRIRIARCLGVQADCLIGPHQVHSPHVVTVSKPFEGDRPKADGIVTATPGLAIGVLTADCGPVLFADNETGVVGAAHAGWKGALSGVLENTVAAMEALGARRGNIAAVLGPMISQNSYEVGPEFHDRFVNTEVANERWFIPSDKPGHFMFDLAGYIVWRLQQAGLAAESLGRCTYAEETHFFSYRRTTHRGEPDYGRQISAIVLGEN